MTDGLPAYYSACRKAFFQADHIRHIRFKSDRNNNKMERMDGEIRDREKKNERTEDERNTDSLRLSDFPQLHPRA